MSDNRQKEEWYNNKQLFEMISGLKDDLQKTREIISKYNGLRENQGEMQEDVEDLQDRVSKIENQKKGRNQISQTILNWGGWIIALLTLLILAVQSGVIG